MKLFYLKRVSFAFTQQHPPPLPPLNNGYNITTLD